MSDNTAPERPVTVVDDTDIWRWDHTNWLEEGELLSSAAVTELVTTDLGSIAAPTVFIAETEVNDRAVAIGKGFFFTTSGHVVANSPYTLKAVCVTDAGRTKTKFAVFEVEADG